jgi:hypothetical protein
VILLRIEYSVAEMASQRVYALASGNEDLKLCAARLDFSFSTRSRLEQWCAFSAMASESSPALNAIV